MPEYRIGQLELRSDGRTIFGRLFAYGDAAAVMHVRTGTRLIERIAPAAFAPLPAAPVVDIEHRAAAIEGAAVSFDDSDSALCAVIRLPDSVEGRAALADVRDGRLRGLSAEFRALAESIDWEQRTRLITRGLLEGLALTANPAYQSAAGLEIRALACPSCGSDGDAHWGGTRSRGDAEKRADGRVRASDSAEFVPIPLEFDESGQFPAESRGAADGQNGATGVLRRSEGRRRWL